MQIHEKVTDKVCQFEGLRPYQCEVAWVTTSEALSSTNKKEEVVFAPLDHPVEGVQGRTNGVTC